MTHGTSYNYDTLIVGFITAVNSVLGLPWLVAATVRSLNHLHALGTKTPDGKFISVQETRLTHLFVHVLVLISIFFLNVIKLIPVPVLFGVFLYMGLVSLGTNQFWGRLTMFFMQPSKYPEEPYTKYMDAKKMHIYTLLQLFLFVLLYAVKSIKVIAIAFPIVIAACIPFRMYILPRIFSEGELIVLDSEDEVIEEWIRNHKNDEEIQNNTVRPLSMQSMHELSVQNSKVPLNVDNKEFAPSSASEQSSSSITPDGDENGEPVALLASCDEIER